MISGFRREVDENCVLLGVVPKSRQEIVSTRCTTTQKSAVVFSKMGFSRQFIVELVLRVVTPWVGQRVFVVSEQPTSSVSSKTQYVFAIRWCTRI